MSKLPGGFRLLAPAADVCHACAVKHEPGEPHNQQSLHWQFWFYGQHGRWPTWADAMAHCSERTKALWVRELGKRGVKVELPIEVTVDGQ